MDVLIEIVIGAFAGVFFSVGWMILPWMPTIIIEELRKNYRDGDWLSMIFNIPNVILATLPFWLVYGVYDYRGFACSTAFAIGLFWFQLRFLWAWATYRDES